MPLYYTFQVWFWRCYLVYLWAGPWGLTLWQRWNMPLSKIQGHFEGARCWECWVVSGLHCAGHLFCLTASYCLLCPPLQNQCREVDKTATTLTRHLHPRMGDLREQKWVILSSAVPIGQQYTEWFRLLTVPLVYCFGLKETWISVWIDILSTCTTHSWFKQISVNRAVQCSICLGIIDSK